MTPPSARRCVTVYLGSGSLLSPVGGANPVPVWEDVGLDVFVPWPPVLGRAGWCVDVRPVWSDLPVFLVDSPLDAEMARGAVVLDVTPELLLSDVEVDEFDMDAGCIPSAAVVEAGAYGSLAP
ncbi:hypothetical protein B484DRAFT_405981 [Ochromonadaceae sp. CCMP2298]|nr:hypothetical protein B484DRAFT_405981 [Ochromonadaceae sp. CCMP2298]